MGCPPFHACSSDDRAVGRLHRRDRLAGPVRRVKDELRVAGQNSGLPQLGQRLGRQRHPMGAFALVPDLRDGPPVT